MKHVMKKTMSICQFCRISTDVFLNHMMELTNDKHETHVLPRESMTSQRSHWFAVMFVISWCLPKPCNSGLENLFVCMKGTLLI